jgi:hypothetical protein
VDYRKLGIKVDAPLYFFCINYFSEQPLCTKEELITADLLTNPIKFFPSNQIEREYVQVFNAAETFFDPIVGYTRRFNPSYRLGFQSNEEMDWWIFKDYNENGIEQFKSKYEEVKHLEHYGVINEKLLKYRIAIEYAKLNHFEFDLSEHRELWLGDYAKKVSQRLVKRDSEKYMKTKFYFTYLESFDIPIFSTIPEEMRFKPKNFE